MMEGCCFLTGKKVSACLSPAIEFSGLRSLFYFSSVIKCRSPRIVYIVSYCSVLYPFNRLIDCEKRDKEPLFRSDGIPKSIVYFNIQAGTTKNPVDQVFKLCAVDIVEFVCRYD